MKDHTGETSPEEANVIQDWIEPRAALHRAQRRRLVQTQRVGCGEIKRGVNKVK